MKSEIRKLYNFAHKEKGQCDEIINLCETKNDLFSLGYFATAKMVSSKYFLNPFVIIKVFNEGRTLLEKLISENVGDVELRYSRYTIQMNTPKFVGYDKCKLEDREILINFIRSSQDLDLKEHILFYLKDTNDVLPEEKDLH
jgi:hypothetical protein